MTDLSWPTNGPYSEKQRAHHYEEMDRVGGMWRVEMEYETVTSTPGVFMPQELAFYIFDLAKLKPTLCRHLASLTRVLSSTVPDHPQPLRISLVRVIPIRDVEVYWPNDLGLNEFVEREVAWVRHLRNAGRLHKGAGEYNMEMAPANRESLDKEG